jgi:hypothetical protein
MRYNRKISGAGVRRIRSHIAIAIHISFHDSHVSVNSQIHSSVGIVIGAVGAFIGAVVMAFIRCVGSAIVLIIIHRMIPLLVMGVMRILLRVVEVVGVSRGDVRALGVEAHLSLREHVTYSGGVVFV